MTKTNCIAEDALASASIIEIDGVLLHNWILEELDDIEDDDTAFSCSYTDDEGLIFNFEVTKKELKNAKIGKHHLQLVDIARDTILVNLYNLTPMSI